MSSSSIIFMGTSMLLIAASAGFSLFTLLKHQKKDE